MVDKTNFEQKFKTRIPCRDEWATGKLDDTFEISLYTDGFKTDCGVGAGGYSPDLEVEKTFHLPGGSASEQGGQRGQHTHIPGQTEASECDSE